MEQKQEPPRFILILGSLFLFAYVAFNLGTAWMDSVSREIAAAYSPTPTVYQTPTVSPTSVPDLRITPTITPGGGPPQTSKESGSATAVPTTSGRYPAPETPTGGEYPPPATATTVSTTPTSQADQPTATPTNLPTDTPSATPNSGNGYPGPGEDTNPYPGPGSTATPRPTQTATTGAEGSQPSPTPTPSPPAAPTEGTSIPGPRRTPGPAITELEFSETTIVIDGSVNQAIWAQNATELAMATSKGIYLYHSEDLKKQGTLDLGSSIASVAYTSNDDLIAAGGNDASIRVWDRSNKSFVMNLPGHMLGVIRLNFSQAGDFLASGSDDATVRIWDVSGNLLFTLNDPETRVTDLDVSSTAQMVAASSNRHVHIWSPMTGSLIRTIHQPVGWYQAVAFNPESSRLVTAYEDRRLEFWDTITWARTQVLPQKQRIQFLAFSPDGSMLAAAYEDGRIKIWDPWSLALLVDISGKDDITSMMFNPVSDKLLTSSADGTIRIWDLSPLSIPE